MLNRPVSCYIFPNGNIIVFDRKGKQMVRYQRDGLAALGRVMRAAPAGCKFYWSFFGKWAEEVSKESLGWLWERVLAVKGKP